jgi:hypothetical protein
VIDPAMSLSKWKAAEMRFATDENQMHTDNALILNTLKIEQFEHLRFAHRVCA